MKGETKLTSLPLHAIPSSPRIKPDTFYLLHEYLLNDSTEQLLGDFRSIISLNAQYNFVR